MSAPGHQAVLAKDNTPPLAGVPSLLGVLPDDAEWHALPGGRTNRLWRVGDGPDAVVVKLFVADGGTPLFPNDPDAEAKALIHLAPHGLAPRLLYAEKTKHGACVIYSHVQGQVGAVAPVEMGHALARLHRIAPPAGLRHMASGSQAILAQGDSILDLCRDRRALDAMRPEITVAASLQSVFLHCDPVPANAIATADGACLIDWQCPAVGDPVEDLAICLSPAMQHLYGSSQWDAAAQGAFLDGYGNPQIAQRLTALAPALHWRMAAYCQWRIENGGRGDHVALELECAALRASVQKQ